MPSTPLLSKLKADFSHLHFRISESFCWSPEEQTVYYNTGDAHGDGLLLHEVAHGLLKHRQYSRDIELISIETEAWTKARTLAAAYGVALNEDTIQDHLDTYRDWLHARSRCPQCEATGLQTQRSQYRCLACGHHWRVNEARVCALRRYGLSNQKTSA